MSAEYFIDTEVGVVFVSLKGVFTYNKSLHLLSQLRSEPELHPNFNQLIDLTAVEKMEFTSEQVRALATQFVLSPDSKRAYIATTDLQFGLTRMFGTYREIRSQHSISIFHSRDTALSWLGLLVDYLAIPRANQKSLVLSLTC